MVRSAGLALLALLLMAPAAGASTLSLGSGDAGILGSGGPILNVNELRRCGLTTLFLQKRENSKSK